MWRQWWGLAQRGVVWVVEEGKKTGSILTVTVFQLEFQMWKMKKIRTYLSFCIKQSTSTEISSLPTLKLGMCLTFSVNLDEKCYNNTLVQNLVKGIYHIFESWEDKVHKGQTIGGKLNFSLLLIHSGFTTICEIQCYLLSAQ